MSTDPHVYEFSLYNRNVRNLLEIGKSHRTLDDGWSDQRYITIKAANEEKATQEVLRRFPVDKGYVLVSVNKLPEQGLI